MMDAPVFYAVELEAYAPGMTAVTTTPGHGVRPHGAYVDVSTAASTETLRASDIGFRTLANDTPASAIYPPVLSDVFALDRKISIDPTDAAASVAWGKVSFSNADGRYDNTAATRNSDSRPVRIFGGAKAYDAVRGYYVDPLYAQLQSLFQGIALPWTLTENSLEVPIRDASYWLERPLQQTTYLGTGTYEGGADILGLPKPKTRGGTSGSPVQNVTPVLVDPTNRIYQYNDGPGTVVAVVEGGNQSNITFQANTSNLYSGTTTAGSYRTDNSRGLFQLGTAPVRTLTCDVTGQFPIAGTRTTLAAIVRYLLSEDLALPAGNLDTAAFTALDTAAPYLAGCYFGPQAVDGQAAVTQLLASAGWKLVPLRSGALSVRALRSVDGKMPVATLSPANAASCVPQGMPTNLSPEPYRFRVGYQANWTPSLSDISPAVTDMARKSFLATAWRYATAASTATLTRLRRPNDPAPINGVLLAQADAATVAADLLALWSVRRRLYAVQVPVAVGMALDIGNVVTLVWPTDDLRNGRLGQIVGDQLRAGDAAITLLVLI